MGLPSLSRIQPFKNRYLAPTLDFHNEEFVMMAIRKDFLRNLPQVQPDLFEDMKSSVDLLFGMNTEDWSDVCLWEAMEQIIFRSTIRIFFGRELSENENYMKFSRSFAFWLGIGSVFVGQLIPAVIRPAVGYFAAIPVYVFRTKSLKYLTPLIAQRLNDMKQHKNDQLSIPEIPNDLVTWILNRFLNSDHPGHTSPAIIAEQLLYFTLGATHTTITTATNAVFDILSAPPEMRVYETLRKELEPVFTTTSAWEDPAFLKHLPLTESAIRETLRLSPVITRVVMRQVMERDGIRLPDGNRLPYGSWAGATAMGVHGDEDLYPNPQQYKPFRFVYKEAGKKISQQPRSENISTINEKYLSFGLGKNACLWPYDLQT
ncbi:MAG: hypothetical protein Q9214_004324 [Letrouitia sp. 1 TL-2023]